MGQALAVGREHGRYRLCVEAAQGAVAQLVPLSAASDEAALNEAIRRLGGAHAVDVWSHARWVGRVQRR